MQDFVDVDIEDGYKVRLFFKGHSWDKPKPENLDEFEALFQNASEMIEKRTKRIVDALVAEYKQIDSIMKKLDKIGAKK